MKICCFEGDAFLLSYIVFQYNVKGLIYGTELDSAIFHPFMNFYMN